MHNKTYKKNNVAIYLVDSHKEYVGIGEFEMAIGSRIATQARQMREEYNITLYFIVTKDMYGKFGPDVKYIVINDLKKTLINWDFTGLFRKLFIPHLDLVHITQQYPKLHRSIGDRTLVTIHDVNFFHDSSFSANSIARKKKRILRMLSIATHLSFISDFTDNDVKKHFDIHVPCRTIKNGVTNLTQCVRENFTHQLNIPDHFLLHISSLESKKNVELMIEMMAHLKNENLVLAGRASKERTQIFKNLICRLNLKNVFLLGYVTREEKAELYRRCKGFLFPSRSEGFGLPVLESMLFGKPTFISRLTSLPEVGSDIAFYYDKLIPEAMAKVTNDGLLKYANAPEEYQKKAIAHAETYNWDNAANEYIKYYNDILTGNAI